MVKKLIAGPMMVNCYIVHDTMSKKGTIIDPAGNFDKARKYIEQNSLDIEYILLTHGHYDHITALKKFKDYTGADILIHQRDRQMLTDPEKNLSLISYKRPVVQVDADGIVEDGDIIKVGNLDIKTIHTPGHSSGSVCYATYDALFSGDTLFSGYIGRTKDFPGANAQDLKDSLINKVLILPQSFILYPGHGINSTIKNEILKNPYLKAL